MKLSRRCFLSLSIGGTVGTALTPLPWKLTDDMSIWSQNWPWTPVPPDGAYTYINSTCTLCPGHCGIRVRKVDGRAIKIEGQEGTPLNQGGGLCPLGLSGLQLLYGPRRIQGPLKRDGERGKGQWKPISWQQAIEEVSRKLADIRSQGKPQSLACLTDSDTGTVPQLFKRFLNAYGSPNFFRMPSVEDAYESVLSLTQGVDGFAGLDLYNADFILSFGSALLDGYGAPPRVMQAISRLKEQNGTLVQVEHRLSNTAAKANIWLAAKPGTEADLALSMAYVIIAQQKYDTDFIGTHTEGFEAFVRMVQERFDPQKVAAYCGVEADVIVRTALAFAAAQKPLAVYGKGKGQTAGSLREALAVHALNALVGNINRVGGVQAIPAYDYLQWPAVMTDETAAAGLQTQRLDRARSPEFSHAQAIVHRLFETVNASPGDVQALFVAEANPCYSLPGTAKVQEAFDKIPFVVSFSSYMDETAMQADLILPNHVYLERYEDVPVRSGTTRPMIGLCQPVVAPQLNTRHVGDSVILIAKALKGAVAESFPWADYESCLQEALGDQWDAISDQGFWAAAESAPASWDNGFGTPSGKFTLMNETIAAVYQAGQPSVAGDASDYLLLLMPYDSIRLTSRYVGGTPFMIKTVADTVLKGQDGFVDLNPETAAHIGLGEGQAVRLSTPVGEARVRVHLDDGVMPGIVSIPRGLGHTAQGPFLAGKGVNVNRLIAPVEDPASGLDAAWGIRAKLTKA